MTQEHELAVRVSLFMFSVAPGCAADGANSEVESICCGGKGTVEKHGISSDSPSRLRAVGFGRFSLGMVGNGVVGCNRGRGFLSAIGVTAYKISSFVTNASVCESQ